MRTLCGQEKVILLQDILWPYQKCIILMVWTVPLELYTAQPRAVSLSCWLVTPNTLNSYLVTASHVSSSFSIGRTRHKTQFCPKRDKRVSAGDFFTGKKHMSQQKELILSPSSPTCFQIGRLLCMDETCYSQLDTMRRTRELQRHIFRILIQLRHWNNLEPPSNFL